MTNRSRSSFLLPSRAKAGGLVAALLLPVPALFGQSLVNAGFESETFTGSVDTNSAISGWTTTTPALVGLNQFANNGTAPGGNYAFIQTGGVLKTTVSGLTVGTTYHVTFRANAATGSVPYLSFSTDASALVQSAKINPVAGTADYRYLAYDFTATAASQELTIANTRATGTHDLVIDAFEVTASNNTWSYHAWTDDASSGIDSQYAYTHAVDFATTTARKINGVPFIASNTTNVQLGNGAEVEYNVPGRIAVTGLGVSAAFGTMGITGDSLGVAKDFRAGNATVTLSNLKPNTAYVGSFYGGGWDPATTEDRYRAATFTVSTSPQKMTVDLDQFGYQQGIVVDCHYVSDANGTAVLSMLATGANTWHTSAFSNREAAADTGESGWAHRLWTGDGDSGIDGTYTYTHAYNFAGSGNAVINGVAFTDLAGNNPTTATFSSYRLQGGGGVNDAFTNVTGTSAALTPYFHWAYTPNVMTLFGLTAGKKYVFTLYSVGWDNVRELLCVGSAGGKTMQVNQGVYGVDNGICMDYTYVAPPSGIVVISVSGFGGSYAPHNYAITNREAAAAAGVAPSFSQHPADASIAAGTNHTLTTGAIGSPVLHYQWYKDGGMISGADDASYTITSATSNDAGSYTCKVTNDVDPVGVTSNAAVVSVRDAIPGLFATGAAWDRSLLADGAVDPHYSFAVNPHDSGSSTVYSTTGHPAWAPINTSSKWVGPVASYAINGASAMDPYYVYRTEFHLGGFDPATVSITGKWFCDNRGITIRLNGTPIGFPNTVGTTFGNFVAFTIDPTVVASSGAVLYTNQPNTLDFVVSNDGAGSTGLMVRDLQGTGVIAANTAPVISVQPKSTGGDVGSTVVLGVVASGSGPLSYQWKHNGVAVGSPTVNPWLAIALEEAEDYGSYTVTVSNAANPAGVTSSAAEVTLPVLPLYEATTEKNTPAQIDSLDILFVMGPQYQFGTHDATTAEGGTLAMDGNGFITYTPPAGFVGTDSFHYTLTSTAGTHPGLVEITVTGVPDDISPGPVSLTLTPSLGQVTAAFTGVPGVNYTLLRSTTLAAGSWQEVGSMVAPQSGVVSIPDNSPPAGRAFYRVSY